MYYNKIVIVDCTFQGILTADTDNKSLVVSLKLYQKYPLYVKYFHDLQYSETPHNHRASTKER